MTGDRSPRRVVTSHAPEEKESTMGALPKKVLIATDGYEDGDLAARFATSLAGSVGAELRVATVRPEYPLYALLDDTADFSEIYEKEKREAREMLDAQIQKGEALGGKVHGAHQRSGKLKEVVLDPAEDIDEDLVVVGSRDPYEVHRALMGSVYPYVVHHAHCPVLVVRRESGVTVGQP